MVMLSMLAHGVAGDGIVQADGLSDRCEQGKQAVISSEATQLASHRGVCKLA